MADPGVPTQLWRGVVACRVASLAYATALVLANRDQYVRPGTALVGLAVMESSTVAMIVANSRDRGRSWPVVAADHAVTPPGGAGRR